MLVRLEHDGYIGLGADRCPAPRARRPEAESYQAACQAGVVAELLPAYRAIGPAPADEPGRQAAFWGVCAGRRRSRVIHACVRLPDGRLWWVASAGLLPGAAPGPSPDVRA